MHAFLDKNRVSAVTAAAVILAALGLYNYIFTGIYSVNIVKCLRDPEKYDKTLVEVGQDARVLDTGEDGFIIRHMNTKIKAFYPKTGSGMKAEKAARGSYVSVLAVFYKEGYLEIERFHIHKHRKYKIFISLAVAVAFTVFFFCFYRFDAAKCVFRERNA